ncbi:unnamed protein product [Thelazia callipaeda]|uniref:ShTK domain protein n=1 Tax=Thelazia callipaeda TaxID=103827 RepID=A0A0N5CPC2_THECL|nr:unnamed protein product [Thelazia callipaeda]
MSLLVICFIFAALVTESVNSQGDCDCENDYEPPFCETITAVNERYCYTNGKLTDALTLQGIHCAKNCGTCCKLQRFQCSDMPVHLDCNYVKTSGLCGSSNGAVSGLINMECARTCGTCGQECVDSNPILCSIMKSSCQSSESQRLCPKTCGVCEPANVCFDMGNFCSNLRDSCNDPKLMPLMMTSCNKTCNFCDAQPSEVPPQPTSPSVAGPCANTDPRCPTWAANGFCSNPFYAPQVGNCRRSCNLCQ